MPKLKINDSNIYYLEYLPQDITHLCISGCKNIALHDLPPTLEKLECCYIVVLILPDTLPPNLTHLSITFCNLTNIPAFPKTLSYIDISNNLNIKTLSELPPNLTCLKIRDTRIKTLPDLPESLHSNGRIILNDKCLKYYNILPTDDIPDILEKVKELNDNAAMTQYIVK